MQRVFEKREVMISAIRSTPLCFGRDIFWRRLVQSFDIASRYWVEGSKGPESGVANKDEESESSGDDRDGDQEQQTVRDRVHT